MPYRQIVNVASVPTRSPFRYPGGKTWLIPTIRQWMRCVPIRPELFIEPFAGGGSVSLTVLFEDFADRITLVELDSDVSAVWRAIASGKYPELSSRIREFDISRERVIGELASSSTNTLDVAFRTLLKNRTFFGGILAPGAGLTKQGENGRGLASRWYPKTLADRIDAIGSVRDRITVIEGDGIAEMEKHLTDDKAMFFIDPPYTVDGKKAGSRLYRFNELDHDRLFDVTACLKGDFLMTYDDTARVRDMARQRGFDIEHIAMKGTHHLRRTELLIGRNLDWARTRDERYVQLGLKFE